jgi:hypothetical protein
MGLTKHLLAIDILEAIGSVKILARNTLAIRVQPIIAHAHA